MAPRDEAAPPRALQVSCPTCATRSVYGPSNPWRPFCSERCKSVDLGAWASERFRVDGGTPNDDDTGEAAPPAAPPMG